MVRLLQVLSILSATRNQDNPAKGVSKLVKTLFCSAGVSDTTSMCTNPPQYSQTMAQTHMQVRQ